MTEYIKDTPLSVQDLRQYHTAVVPKMMEYWADMDKNQRLRRGDHFNEGDKKKIEAQNRLPYSVAMTSHKLTMLSSAQKNKRTSMKIEAVRDPNDEIKAALGTIQIKDFEKRNKMKHATDEMFEEGISLKYSVGRLDVGLDSDFEQCVTFKKLHPKDFVWDINSTDYSHNDSWVAELERLPRREYAKMYGQQFADRLAVTTETYEWGRENIINYFVKHSGGGGSPDDLITRIIHWHPVDRKCYVVWFNDFANLHGLQGKEIAGKFYDKQEAEATARKLKAPYIMKYGLVPGVEIREETKQMFDKYIFTYEGILEYEETTLEKHPYVVYHPFHNSYDVWCMTDLLRDIQLFYDRVLMQIDYAFGKDIKNVYEVNVNMLDDTYEQMLNKIESGLPIKVKQTGAINPIQSQGANPQFMGMLQTLQSIVEDLTGGRSFQGLSEGAGESGRAILAKQQQGEMLAGYFIHNLSRFKSDLGEKVVMMIKNYETASRIVKISGADLSPAMLQELQKEGLYEPSKQTKGDGYVRLPDDNLSFLNNFDYELVITEEFFSEAERERRLMMMYEQEKANPQLAMLPKWFELKLEYENIPYADRMELLDQYNQMQQAQQAAAQAEQDLEQQKVNVQKAGVINSMQMPEQKKEKK